MMPIAGKFSIPKAIEIFSRSQQYGARETQLWG